MLATPISGEAARVFSPNPSEVRIVEQGFEVNDVTVRGSQLPEGGWTVHVTDAGTAPPVPGDECASTATGVRCTGPHFNSVRALLKRGSDQFDGTRLSAGMFLVVRAGAGDDRLLGALHAENHFLRGGSGDDFVRVGPASPYAEVDGGPGSDLIIGGDRAFEFLEGGTGEDMMEGRGGIEVLRGEAGTDLLRGGDGKDRLYPGTEEDEVFAGAGADQIDAVDGEHDVVECGSGRDKVDADRYDSVFGCERIR